MTEMQTRNTMLYVAVLETRGYVVGSANAPSGMHRFDGGTQWTHLGWRNVRCHGLAFDAARPGVCFLAAGNGVFRTRDDGRSWRITTGWEITEVLDVAVDPHVSGRVYAATAYGAWRSDDDGDSWQAASTGIPAPRATFLQVIEADRDRPDHVLAGSEEGVFRSTDGAGHWHHVGLPGVAIRDLRQSAADPSLWLAGTEDRGVLCSRDEGATWGFLDAPALQGQTLYAVALDPAQPERMAAAGYRTGVLASTDGGRHWAAYGTGLPEPTVHGLIFEPDGSGRLWAGTVGAGVFFADAAGERWTYAGLDEATIYDMAFVGGAA